MRMKRTAVYRLVYMMVREFGRGVNDLAPIRFKTNNRIFNIIRRAKLCEININLMKVMK